MVTYHCAMTYSSESIAKKFPSLVIEVRGKHCEFSHTSDPQSSDSDSLVFLSNSELLPEAAAVVVTNSEVAEAIVTKTQAVVIVVKDVRLAMALIKQEYHDFLYRDQAWGDIHQSAVIHESVKIGANVRIGPNAVIGANSELAEGVIVEAGAVVEQKVIIGEMSVVHSNAVIGHSCVLGKRVIIKNNAVIGSEGFGFAQDQNRSSKRVPHTGNVELQDDVRVGAGSLIDRATYGTTLIKRGTKLDNLVHIAHNVELGEDVLIAGMSGVSGSTKVGNRVIFSGQVGVADHLTIADDVVLVHQAAVYQSILEPGMYAGNPARPYKEHMQRSRVLKSLKRLQDKVAELTKKIDGN